MMKTIKLILTTTSLFIFLACGPQQDAKPATTSDQVTARDAPTRSGTVDRARADRPTRDMQPKTGHTDPTTADLEPGTAGHTTQQHPDMTTEDWNDMYIHLKMTPDQIQQFEDMDMEYRHIPPGSQPMSQAELQQKRDENLRGILTTEQYGKYQQWRIDNP